MFRWLLDQNSTANQLAEEKAQNRLLQVALTEALAASQELCHQHPISMARVIINGFDRPYVPTPHGPVAHHTLPIPSLSDVLSMYEADFVTRD